MNRVLIAANLENPQVHPLLVDLRPALAERGLETVTAQELNIAVPSIPPIPGEERPELKWGEPMPDVDLVVVLGGDGFMMALTRALGFPATPFYGVNFGRVGFLMNPPAAATDLAGLIAESTWTRASYPVLEATITLSDGRSIVERAFNDFVIERASGQTVELLTYIDEVLLNRYSGDGLIVATPGGSTAYSLAAGGPVVHPLVDSMMLTPLCPHRPIQFHSLQFPLLLTLESRIRVVNSDRQKRPCRCVADGRSVEEVSEVSIQHDGLRIELLRGPGYSFVDTLVHKVIGGANVRDSRTT